MIHRLLKHEKKSVRDETDLVDRILHDFSEEVELENGDNYFVCSKDLMDKIEALKFKNMKPRFNILKKIMVDGRSHDKPLKF